MRWQVTTMLLGVAASAVRMEPDSATPRGLSPDLLADVSQGSGADPVRRTLEDARRDIEEELDIVHKLEQEESNGQAAEGGGTEAPVAPRSAAPAAAVPHDAQGYGSGEVQAVAMRAVQDLAQRVGAGSKATCMTVYTLGGGGSPQALTSPICDKDESVSFADWSTRKVTAEELESLKGALPACGAAPEACDNGAELRGLLALTHKYGRGWASAPSPLLLAFSGHPCLDAGGHCLPTLSEVAREQQGAKVRSDAPCRGRTADSPPPGTHALPQELYMAYMPALDENAQRPPTTSDIAASKLLLAGGWKGVYRADTAGHCFVTDESHDSAACV